MSTPTKKVGDKTQGVPSTSKSRGIGLDWAVFTSPPTQYRLYERRFLQVKRPN